MTRADWFSAAVLWLATLAVFGAGAARLGFHGDDSAFLTILPFADVQHLWANMRSSMPGRGLDPLWRYLLYKLVGDPFTHLPLLHLVQSAIDGLVTAGFFFLLRFLGLPACVALIAAAWFAFWPLHGETHFWSVLFPMNLLYSLVILLATTSIAFVRGRRAWWLWALDAAAFLAALFTYEQVFFVLPLLIFLRAAAVHEWRFALAHLPYWGAGVFWVWLRTAMQTDPTPPWHDPFAVLAGNVRETARNTMGPVAFERVASFYARVTAADWLLALLVAAVLAALCGWLLSRLPPTSAQPFRWRVSALAVLFSILAYLPVWLWSVATRHHYLPSIGLFAAVALCLVWIFERIRGRTARLLLVLALGAATLVLAAASRGESRFWEDAFAAKQQLFAELKPDLQGKEVLVLEDFPVYLGPAPLIYPPHDVRFAPLVLYHGSLSLGPRFLASTSSAPAPAGVFIETKSSSDPAEFRYCPTDNMLVVRFTSWENGRLTYQKNPPRPLPYQVLSAAVAPREGPFAVRRFSARREGDGVIVSLEFQANVRPHTYVAAVFSFLHGGRFYRWAHSNLLPVLLSDPGPHPRSGGYEWIETLRLDSFPGGERIGVEFYEASRDDNPVPLGRFETAMEQ